MAALKKSLNVSFQMIQLSIEPRPFVAFVAAAWASASAEDGE
jgi:hypothetical protein